MQVYRWILFCFLCGQLTFGLQNESSVQRDKTILKKQSITEDDLKTYKADDDFNYFEADTEKNGLDKVFAWLQNFLQEFWEAIFGAGTASGFIYFVFRILPYILLGLLLFLLIKFFLKVNSNNLINKVKENGTVTLTEEEQIIQNEDIPALIKEAINQQNYRLAIRYYYLLSLKRLTESDCISWQPQKTNDDYINEIEKTDLKVTFKNITKIYDYVWYGEFAVDALKFENLKTPFETLNKSIEN